MGALDCPVCEDRYDTASKKPRSLNCLHTFCSSCIQSMIKIGPLKCPLCRIYQSPKATCVVDVPFNYALLDLLQEQASGKGPSNSTLCEAKRADKHAISEHIEMCNDIVTRINELKKIIHSERKKKEDELRTLSEKEDRLQGTLSEGEERLETLEKVYSHVVSATSLHEMTATRLDAQRCFKDTKEWVESARSMLPKKLEPRASLSQLKIDNVTAERLKETLTVAASGGLQVYAVLQEANRLRHGRLTLQEGRLLLHALLDTRPNPDDITLPYGVVRALVTKMTKVFLELSWARSIHGTVVIEVTSESLTAKQFLSLCTGQLGPSFTLTPFHEVHKKGHKGETLQGGDYDGMGGANLCSGPAEDFDPRVLATTGVVFRLVSGDPTQGAKFGIITKDGHHDSYVGAFGKVVTGLKVIQAAVAVKDIRDVVISACGVVLSQ